MRSAPTTSVLTCVAVSLAVPLLLLTTPRRVHAQPTTAPAGYDNLNNTFEDDDQFEKDKEGFDEIEQICRKLDPDPEKTIKGGLGPVYNDTACANCHQNPVSGSAGQTLEIRAGFTLPNLPGRRPSLIFAEPTGGSLIHQRATDARIQEHVPESDPQAPGGIPVRTLRLTTNIMGDGFVEVIPDDDLLGYQAKQPDHMKGVGIPVPVAVQAKGSDGKPVLVERIGRFGWKCQEASLLNFAAGAYLNEMGITSLLNKDENLSRDGKGNARFVGFGSGFDPIADDPTPEDPPTADAPFGDDVEAFTRFMRSLTTPPQAIPDGVSPGDVKAGEALFGTDADNDGFFGTPKGTAGIGCFQCHRVTLTTPDEGTFIHTLNDPNQQATDLEDGKVPKALASKRIFPYSDFLLHNIGTGDGITQQHHAENPPTNFENRKKMLTPQLVENIRGAGAKRYNIVDIQRQQTPAARNRPAVVGRPAGDNRPAGERPTEPGRMLVEVAPALPPNTAPGSADLDQRVRNMVRTAPLWGLRTRAHLLHDGSALTVDEAIRRHRGQADEVREAYEALSSTEQKQLLTFLDTLGFGPRKPCPP